MGWNVRRHFDRRESCPRDFPGHGPFTWRARLAKFSWQSRTDYANSRRTTAPSLAQQVTVGIPQQGQRGQSWDFS